VHKAMGGVLADFLGGCRLDQMAGRLGLLEPGRRLGISVVLAVRAGRPRSRRQRRLRAGISEIPKDFLAGFAASAFHSYLVAHSRARLPIAEPICPLTPWQSAFLAMMAAEAPRDRSRPSAEARRQAFAKLMQFARADVTAVSGIDGALPGPAGAIRYRLYAPADATGEPLPGFIFFHGGGMVAGSIETHDLIAAALAQTTGCRLVSIDYRLAPQDKFPSAIEDAIAATQWVSAEAAALGI